MTKMFDLCFKAKSNIKQLLSLPLMYLSREESHGDPDKLRDRELSRVNHREVPQKCLRTLLEVQEFRHHCETPMDFAQVMLRRLFLATSQMKRRNYDDVCQSM